MKLKIEMSCTLCSEKFRHEFEMPAGWLATHEQHDIEDMGFCPKHAVVAEAIAGAALLVAIDEYIEEYKSGKAR